jgi:hypothetical protein
MCRSIHSLHNYVPPAGTDEIQAAALQYVRKVSGMNRPARANQVAFERAVAEIAAATGCLLDDLVALGPAHDRQVDRERARGRYERRMRFSSPGESKVGESSIAEASSGA